AHRAVHEYWQVVHQPVGYFRGHAGRIDLQDLGVGADFDGLLGGAHFQRQIQTHRGSGRHDNVVGDFRLEACAFDTQLVVTHRQIGNGEVTRRSRAGVVISIGSDVNCRYPGAWHDGSRRV